MDRDQAARSLEVIRTLMERSSLYRRALAPLMFLAGTAGVTGGVLSHFVSIDASSAAFVEYWMTFSAVTLSGSLLLARGQALRAREPFWSPPSKRVIQALIPPLVVGFSLGAVATKTDASTWVLASLWMMLYGCALHSAGFFMTRGIKLFGWMLISLGSLALTLFHWKPELLKALTSSDLMGVGFGLTHVAYAVYLRATEARRNDPAM